MECFLALCLFGKYINPSTNQTHPLPDSSLGLIIDTYMYIEKNLFPVPSPFCGIMCFGRLMRLMRSAIISGGGGYFINFVTGVCGPNLQGTPYSYKDQTRNPYLFI